MTDKNKTITLTTHIKTILAIVINAYLITIMQLSTLSFVTFLALSLSVIGSPIVAEESAVSLVDPLNLFAMLADCKGAACKTHVDCAQCGHKCGTTSLKCE